MLSKYLLYTIMILSNSQALPMSGQYDEPYFVTLPTREILENTIQKIGLNNFATTTKIIDKLLEKPLEPLEVATKVREAYYHYDEKFYKPEKNAIQNRNLQRSLLLIAILQNDPLAQRELQGMGLIHPLYKKHLPYNIS